MTNLLWIKLLVIAVLFLFFYLIGKIYKGIIIGILTYIALPTPDDLVTIPIIAGALNLPIGKITLLYYGIAWILLILTLLIL